METFTVNEYIINIKLKERDIAIMRIINIETEDIFMGTPNMGFGLGSYSYTNIVTELKKENAYIKFKIKYDDNIQQNIMTLIVGEFIFNLYKPKSTIEHVFLLEDNKMLQKKIKQLEDKMQQLEDKLNLIEKKNTL